MLSRRQYLLTFFQMVRTLLGRRRALTAVHSLLSLPASSGSVYQLAGLRIHGESCSQAGCQANHRRRFQMEDELLQSLRLERGSVERVAVPSKLVLCCDGS